MDISADIIKAFESFFKENGMEYAPADKEGIIRTGTKLRCTLDACSIVIRVNPDGCTVYFVPLKHAVKDAIKEVMEFITRANMGMKYGNFEMGLDDGSVCFKNSLICADAVPTANQIKGMVFLNLNVIEHFGDALASVMEGRSSAVEALKAMQK